MLKTSAINRVTKTHELTSLLDFVIDDAPSQFLNQRHWSLLAIRWHWMILCHSMTIATTGSVLVSLPGESIAARRHAVAKPWNGHQEGRQRITPGWLQFIDRCCADHGGQSASDADVPWKWTNCSSSSSSSGVGCREIDASLMLFRYGNESHCFNADLSWPSSCESVCQCLSLPMCLRGAKHWNHDRQWIYAPFPSVIRDTLGSSISLGYGTALRRVKERGTVECWALVDA